MKTLILAWGIALVSLVGMGIATADPLAPAVSGQKKDKDGKEKLGVRYEFADSNRVTVKAIGTNTVSPVRVYTREELDRTGRFTTPGILAQDPSVRIIGNGSH